MSNKNSKLLWNKAINLVVGGCGLLSKRPTRYNSSNWPSYYKSAKGIKIKSIDNKWFKDYSEFSIGCNIFGYRPNEHRILLRKLRESPPLTTLLSPEEPQLAEDLNEFLNSNKLWRFTRGGGEALSLAVRYARSITKSDEILVCGYHGWHDWYLASNLSSTNNLNSTFIEGLKPIGVPKFLTNTTYTPKTLDKITIEKTMREKNIKIIVIEAARYEYLDEEISQFLKKFKLEGGLIIADEVTSGFRVEKKTAVSKLEIDPDIIVLGKGLGGGWPIAAIGIDYSYKMIIEDVFASSTFWTEQTGLIAGRLTLKRLKKWDNFYEKLHNNSSSIRRSLINCFSEANINLKINSIETMISYKFKISEFDERESSALFIDKLTKKGYLTSTTIYPTIKHIERENNLFERNIKNSLREINQDIKNPGNDLRNYINSIGYLERGFSRTQSL